MTQTLVADAWLGGLLGRPAFRLSAAADPCTAVVGPAFVDAKAPTTATARVQALSQAGFGLVDTNVQLGRAAGPLSAKSVKATIRMATSNDAEGVVLVAASAFRFDRFHADPAIPRAVADRIKASWAGNFFRGERGDRMVVAADNDAIQGFLQILDRPEYSVIDLIAVAPSAQGRGLAPAMIAHAATNGPSAPWRVGTQVANAPSLRLYERLGFRVTDSQYVFHRHVD